MALMIREILDSLIDLISVMISISKLALVSLSWNRVLEIPNLASW